MIRLVLTDLAAHARVWAGTLAVMVAAGLVGAVAAGLLETGGRYGGQVQEGLASASAAVIMFTAIAAFVVIGSSANLAVSLQRRSYALWQLVGIRPARVMAVVVAQLAIVGALGALVGALLARPVFAELFRWVFGDWTGMGDVVPAIGPAGIGATVAVEVGVVVAGGFRGARRAGRTPPIEALREPEDPRVRMGWIRSILTLLLCEAVVLVSASLDGSASLSAFSGQAILMTPLIAAVLAAAGPLTFPLALRAWTAVAPVRASAAWFLARHAARHRLGRSTAAIGPLMVAVALAGGLATMADSIAAAQSVDAGLEPEGVVLLLGGPLLLSAVAAAATVFMSGRAREREFALIQAAGSTHATIVLAAVYEAVVYAVTAALLGALAVLIDGAVIAGHLGLAWPRVAFAPMALVAAGGLVLLLVATVAPTAAALRRPIPRTLAGV